MKYISILRGINVSGKNKIIMTDLKALYESLGYKNVVTYIQSGNVIFETNKKNTVKIIEAIEQQYEFHVPIEIRTSLEMKNVIKHCPFGKVDLSKDGTKVLVTFLNEVPDKNKMSKLLGKVFLPEKMIVHGREVYLFCPNGYGESKFSNVFIEKNIDVSATTRNWKSVHKLYELSA